MSDCISLIDTRVDFNQVAQWVDVNQMTHVLHTEEITIRSVASGNLDIEPFCIENVDCRIVGGLVYHCCGTGVIHSWTQEVICHVFQDGKDTCVKLDCWELNPKEQAEQNLVCWTDDPCQRLHELRCCEMQWLKEGKKTSWDFRDSSGDIQFLSGARLKELISQADAECDAKCGRNTRCASYSWNPSICG